VGLVLSNHCFPLINHIFVRSDISVAGFGLDMGVCDFSLLIVERASQWSFDSSAQ
jgi:hypothetical protein